jgi:hypothetical protein
MSKAPLEKWRPKLAQEHLDWTKLQPMSSRQALTWLEHEMKGEPEGGDAEVSRLGCCGQQAWEGWRRAVEGKCLGWEQ